MAATFSQQDSTPCMAGNELKSIKELAETSNFSFIPSNYAYFSNHASSDIIDATFHDSIPVIDFSLLESGTPHQRSKMIQELGKACEEWGFFMVINHGVPESLVKAMIDKCNEFFNLTAEEKLEFEGKYVLDPIRCGTSFNASTEEVHCWRDFLKVMVHPKFHCPTKPRNFSEVSSEYCKQVRRMVDVLLRGLSTSLGLDEFEIKRSMNLEAGQQILVANYYPPCPRPDLVIGMPPHSDHGFLTLVAQNQGGGLQIMHDGKWVQVNALPNSLLINTGDQLEIFTNGKYKSVLHRAIVRNKNSRISLVTTNGPSLDTIVTPSQQLVDFGNQDDFVTYKSMAYREYLKLQQNKRLDGKSALNIVKI